MRLTAMAFFCLLAAVGAQAGAPVQGTYYSYDMPGGSFNTGRFSESWAGPGRHGAIGNTVNAQSWNGTALGTEWKLWCPSIQTPPVLVADTRDGNGTGDVTWRTVYSGGHFFLGEPGPWGDEDYNGDLANFIVTTTYQFVFGDLLGIRSNVVSWGQIDGYTDCMEYEINNAAFFGTTDMGPLPADYPRVFGRVLQYGRVVPRADGGVRRRSRSGSRGSAGSPSSLPPGEGSSRSTESRK